MFRVGNLEVAWLQDEEWVVFDLDYPPYEKVLFKGTLVECRDFAELEEDRRIQNE